MKRREFFNIIGGVAVTGVTISTAGCLGSDDDDQNTPVVDPSTGGDSDVDGNGSVDIEQAAEYIETAEEELNEATEHIDNEVRSFDGVTLDGLGSFNSSVIHEHRENAVRVLDEAEPVASEGQQVMIDELRTFSDGLELIGGVFDGFDRIITSYKDLEEGVRSHEIGAARNAVDTYRTELEETTTTFGNARDILRNVSEEALEELSLFTPGYLNSRIVGIDETLSLFASLEFGLEDFVNGADHYVDAVTAVRNGELVTAGTALSESLPYFNDAQLEFAEFEDEVAVTYQPEVQRFKCFAGENVETFSILIEGIEAEVNGDGSTGTTKLMEASQVYGTCRYNLLEGVIEEFEEDLF